MKVCKKKVPTAKVIRIHDITMLKQFEEVLNFTAIFLVRDPRAVLLSRMEIFKSESYVKRGKGKETDVMIRNVQGVCASINNNYHAITTDPFLMKHVMIVKYEDVAKHPKQYAKEILNFVKLDYVTQVDEWINENTRDESGNSSDRLNYNTAHDSKTLIAKWKTELPLDVIQTVEELCKDMMTIFHYDNLTVI